MRVGSIGRGSRVSAPSGAWAPTKSACPNRPACTTPFTADLESASTTAKSASRSESTKS